MSNDKIDEANKPTIFIYSFDIWKAYDHIQLEQLDNLITINCDNLEILAEWKNQLKDMQLLDMDIYGHSISRNIGVPQGGELSPFLFNFVTTCVLKELDTLNLTSEIKIYADNWMLFNVSKELLDKDYNIILAYLAKYNFFVKEKPIYWEFKETIANDKKLDPILDDTANKSKLLGLEFRNKDQKLELNVKEATFPIRKIRASDPHSIILDIKKYYLPKFRYYYNMINIWDANQGRIYKMWFRKAIKEYIQWAAVIVKVPNELLNDLINGSEDRRSNYYWFYAATFNTPFKNPDPYKRKLLERWRALCKWLFEQDKYLGIHTIINYIQDPHERTPDEYIRAYIDKRNLRRTYINLDLVYNCIIARKDMKATMEYIQENINIERSEYMFNPLTKQIRFK